MITLANLTSSRFVGGPERQMLALAGALSENYRTLFWSFREGGRCRELLTAAAKQGFDTYTLEYDTPRLMSAARELAAKLRAERVDLLICQGYKADLLGRMAAWQVGIPAVAVSRGWTAETLKVQVFESLDRRVLSWMDHVVSVSEGQAVKIRRWCGVREDRLSVIRNSVNAERFASPEPEGREELAQMFAGQNVTKIVGAAGRLSPEKGFEILVQAAQTALKEDPTLGFVLFGEGVLRDALARQIQAAGLAGRFILGGFRKDLDTLMPHFDLFVLPSYTEGLPNVVLESLSAGVPVVATAVGGTPEVLDDGQSGFLVPSGDPAALSRRIVDAVSCGHARQAMGQFGRERVDREFTFAAQAEAYDRLFQRLLSQRHANRTRRKKREMASYSRI